MIIEANAGWIQTYTGRQFWPLNPRVEDVCPKDIAHALSNLCRFSGHTKWFYSVAQHSVLVSQIVPPEYALQGLLHDASEAYCVDVPRPIKKALPDYEEIEARVWAVVAEAFDIPAELNPVIKLADNIALATEARDLMGKAPALWESPEDPLEDIRIIALNPRDAERLFLKRLKELWANVPS